MLQDPSLTIWRAGPGLVHDTHVEQLKSTKKSVASARRVAATHRWLGWWRSLIHCASPAAVFCLQSCLPVRTMTSLSLGRVEELDSAAHNPLSWRVRSSSGRATAHRLVFLGLHSS